MNHATFSRVQPASPAQDILAVPLGMGVANAAERLRGLSGFILLESTAPDGELGRYSYLAAEPRQIIRARGRVLDIRERTHRWTARGSPWDFLLHLLEPWRQSPDPTLPPFQGGAIGYFGYDLGCHLESLPTRAVDDLGLPDLWLGVYDWVISQDHVTDQTWLVVPQSAGETLSEVRNRRDRVLRWLEGPSRHSPVVDQPGRVRFRSRTGRQAYREAIQRALQYIQAGDIYQVNLSHRLEADWDGDTWELYRRLRETAPVRYAAYLHLDNQVVVSASPECFLQVAGRWVETRPIKGTRPRGANAAADRALAAELLASDKDRAENLMIVDLLRNDLGRVCAIGSVQVPHLWSLEGYSNVWHLVSTVTGELRPELDVIDLLRACFPGGSVTGCPKIRALEIIDELEPVRRGIYCGAIGYLSFSGGMHASIVIRTLQVTRGRVYLHVGGAIVADSDAQSEYEETLAKGRAALAALDAELVDW